MLLRSVTTVIDAAAAGYLRRVEQILTRQGADQSGLSAAYTSGVTDFTAYTSTTTHDSSSSANLWASSNFSPTGVVTFDLNSVLPIDGLALWNLRLGAGATLRGFNLFADTDADFSNGGTTSLGAFAPPNEVASLVPARVFGFTAVNTQYLHMQITTNDGDTLTGFGEIIFRQADVAAEVPEPGSVGLALIGLVGIGIRFRASRRHQP